MWPKSDTEQMLLNWPKHEPVIRIKHNSAVCRGWCLSLHFIHWHWCRITLVLYTVHIQITLQNINGLGHPDTHCNRNQYDLIWIKHHSYKRAHDSLAHRTHTYCFNGSELMYGVWIYAFTAQHRWVNHSLPQKEREAGEVVLFRWQSSIIALLSWYKSCLVCYTQ